MTKRLVQLVPSLQRGGTQKQASLLAAGLDPKEFEVHVVVLNEDGPLRENIEEHELPIHRIGRRTQVDPFAYLRLKRLIARLRPDLVHSWGAEANPYAQLVNTALGGGQPLVSGLRGTPFWQTGIRSAFDRYLARSTTRFVANGQGVKNFFIQRGLPEDRIKVIPNAVPTPNPSSYTRDELLRIFGLEESVELVGLCGPLIPSKRIKDAIWTNDLIKVVRNNLHLLIFGDGPMRDELIRYRNQVHIVDQVHFLGQRDDVEVILPHLNLLWSTSESEGQSNAIMEAMAAGIPVVAGDLPGNAELVIPGETGYLVPVGNRAAFSKWTQRLLNDPDLARQFGEAGKRRMVEHFGVEKMVGAYTDLYRKLLF